MRSTYRKNTLLE